MTILLKYNPKVECFLLVGLELSTDDIHFIIMESSSSGTDNHFKVTKMSTECIVRSLQWHIITEQNCYVLSASVKWVSDKALPGINSNNLSEKCLFAVLSRQ